MIDHLPLSHQHLFELERKLHSLSVRQNAAEISALLAPEFFEFGSSGRIWSRQDILERLPQEDGGTPIESWNYQATPLSDDVVLVTYVSQRLTDGRPASQFLRSSIWRRINDVWVMAFHQGTPAAGQL